MIGQHIYVRSKNAQNVAGTWTAAMTQNIVDNNIVKNIIEPRCNIDEKFANSALNNDAGKSVLRLYHVGDSVTVITRTYWVASQLTEDGRKGAYSISYILTDDEFVKFNGDFSGAFDEATFESYDSLVGRSSGGKVSINDSFSIFSHPEHSFDGSVFKKAGFTKETFVKLMNGLYAAVDSKKQLVVVLPENIRKSWEETGDNTVDKLSCQIMSMFPDFTRINLGITTHWNCQVNDMMVGDTHLIFVHPNSESEIAGLKNNVMLLDLEGNNTTGIPSLADNYFGFLWDSMDNFERINEFWTYAKSKYRKLLKRVPNRAISMECIYLMKCVSENEFKNDKQLFNAFMLALTEFAGAGTKVPDAESFLYQAFASLNLSKSKVEPAVEDAVCNLMNSDPDSTKHQIQEYEVLLKQCEEGCAKDETVIALSDEVIKLERNPHGYFNTYLQGKKNLKADGITLQLTKFVSQLFIRLVPNSVGSDLLNTVIEVMGAWKETLSEVNELDKQVPFAEAYMEYLEGKASNSGILEICYNFLFEFEQKADGEIRDNCSKVLMKEEKRLYKKKSEFSNPLANLLLFTDCFFDNFFDITKMKKDVAEICYTRLFRLAYKGAPEIVTRATEVYINAIKSSVSSGSADKRLPVLFKCREVALEQIDCSSGIWNKTDVGKVVVLFELLNIENIEQYFPSVERISVLIKWFVNTDINALKVCEYYLRKFQLGEKQFIYREMTDANLINNMFLHVMFGVSDHDLLNDVEINLKLTHQEKLSLIFSSDLIANEYYNRETFEVVFSDWYIGSLTKEVEAAKSIDVSDAKPFLNRIIMEFKQLDGMSQKMFDFKRLAFGYLEDTLYNSISSYNYVKICNLPIQIVKDLTVILGVVDKKPENLHLYSLVKELDDRYAALNYKNFEEYLSKALKPELREVAVQRMTYYINSDDGHDKGKLYKLVMYCNLLSSSERISFNVLSYFDKIKYGDKTDYEKTMFLVKLLYELYSYESSFEIPVAESACQFFDVAFHMDPEAFTTDELMNFFQRINRRYSKDILNYLNRQKRNIPKFGWGMLLKCTIGALLVSILSVLIFMLLVFLGKLGTVFAIGAGAIILVILIALDVIACLIKKNKNDGGKYNAY